MRQDYYSQSQMNCVVCKDPIPADRRRDAVTCSSTCTKARSDYLRSRRDKTSCRYCQRPSNPEDRALFVKWRRAQVATEVNQQLLDACKLALTDFETSPGTDLNVLRRALRGAIEAAEAVQLFEKQQKGRNKKHVPTSEAVQG